LQGWLASSKLEASAGGVPHCGFRHITSTARFFQGAAPMDETLAQRAKNKLTKIYGGGIIFFIVIFGAAIPLFIFFANLN
jgi:hypothetical protein